jgi:hypothetical protein
LTVPGRTAAGGAVVVADPDGVDPVAVPVDGAPWWLWFSAAAGPVAVTDAEPDEVDVDGVRVWPEATPHAPSRTRDDAAHALRLNIRLRRSVMLRVMDVLLVDVQIIPTNDVRS